jgi:hypothetical protein
VARSRLSYAAAVRLLTGGTDPLDLLSRLAGGALLLAAPLSGAALALFDAKGEANALLRDLVGSAPTRIKASRGKAHYELIEAAHTVLVISSYFDAFAELAGPLLAELELTEEERHRIAAGDRMRLRLVPPIPGAVRGFAENLELIEAALLGVHEALLKFAYGLAAGKDRQYPEPRGVAARALELYRGRYVRLAADVPEFAIWAQLDEHAATRAAVREQTETLTRLADLLATAAQGGVPAVEAERRLARHARLVLDRPLWLAGAAEGLSFPTVDQGFVSPRFRIAMADWRAPLGDESWWAAMPARDDLADFLAACIGDPAFTARPLVILGHPGAGKSLLTEVLAARLPAEAFTAVRVPLRRVDPDADIHKQVEATVERLVKEHISWGDLGRASDTTKVVLLDGFDELIQATGIAQSQFIERVATFQQEEWVNGRPVVVVVTSRTLVMDRTVVPDGTVVMKLEPFDAEQMQRWTDAWNAANASHPGFRPLTVAELSPHAGLAGQPLLLLMLALYAAESGARLDAEGLSADQVYRRLLDSFIRRQVREKGTNALGDARFADLELAARHDLAATAFAMFNRGRQYVSEDHLSRDLEALRPVADGTGARLGEPLTRAKRTVAAFFFVHVAQADDDTRAPGRRTYEFLHATFAEYIVAEHTVELLEELADEWRRPRRRAYGVRLDDTPLRALLSHQPLTNGEQVTPFLIALIDRLEPQTRADLREALLELFRSARKRVEDGPYRPTPFDAVNRLAAYTANLVVLAALCDPDGLPVDALSGHPDAVDLASTVRLWRSGLDVEAQNGLFSRLLRQNDRLTARRVEERTLPMCEAQLIGDVFTEAVLEVGRLMWLLPKRGPETYELTPLQRNRHAELIDLLVPNGEAPLSNRGTTPHAEQLYELWRRRPDGDRGPHTATARLLALWLARDVSEQ